MTSNKKLPRNIRYGLLSLEVEELIKKISEKYNLKTPEKVESVSILAKNFLAGFLDEENLKKEIYQRFQFNSETSVDFLVDFKGIIEEIKKIGIKAVKEDLVALRFLELLEKFPQIKQQTIGVHLIFLPQEQEGREPFIENWIADYKLRKNDQQKNTILNVSDYLYNNENTENLTVEEKEELAIVLNSFENNKIVYYNTLFENIDFEIIKLLEKNQKSKNKFSNIKFESKPQYEIDTQNIKTDSIFKKYPELVKTEKNTTETNVLDLNKYI